MYYYYYLVVLLHCQVAVSFGNSLQSADPLLDHQNNTNNGSSTSQYCQRLIKYNQVIGLLSRTSCPSSQTASDLHNNNERTRRDINSGNIDMKALQTTINDHRIMIEYLFNNSINETVMAKALNNHSRTAPSLTSWRDLVDIFCIGITITVIIYFFVCRTGLSLCDKLFVSLLRPVLNRIEQKEQQQLQQQQLTQQPPQQHQTQHQTLNQQHTPILPSAPAQSVSEQLKSLSKMADSIQFNPNRPTTSLPLS